MVNQSRTPSKWGVKRSVQAVIKDPVIIFHKIFLSGCYERLHAQWPVINSVSFCCTDVIQQPQGPTSPPVSVSRKMHSLHPVLDKSLHLSVCVSVCTVVYQVFHILHWYNGFVCAFKTEAWAHFAQKPLDVHRNYYETYFFSFFILVQKQHISSHISLHFPLNRDTVVDLARRVQQICPHAWR